MKNDRSRFCVFFFYARALFRLLSAGRRTRARAVKKKIYSAPLIWDIVLRRELGFPEVVQQKSYNENSDSQKVV
jgi:hypothetical protein